MEKRGGWIIAFVLIISLMVYFTIFFPYQASEEFYGFPIPKGAKLVKEKQGMNSYNWSKASEENGLPTGYAITIKVKGWKLVDREGAISYYVKGKHRIELLSQTDYLAVGRDK